MTQSDVIQLTDLIIQLEYSITPEEMNQRLEIQKSQYYFIFIAEKDEYVVGTISFTII